MAGTLVSPQRGYHSRNPLLLTFFPLHPQTGPTTPTGLKFMAARMILVGPQGPHAAHPSPPHPASSWGRPPRPHFQGEHLPFCILMTSLQKVGSELS